MSESTSSGVGACGVFVVLGLLMTRSWRCCEIEAWRVVVVWIVVVVRVRVRWFDLSGSWVKTRIGSGCGVIEGYEDRE